MPDVAEVAVRGPAAGYDNPEKEKYRNAVWSTFASLVGPKLLPNAVGLLMPSKNGREIAAALRHGFREQNLIAVDENPAVLATARWRKRYPDVRCYGNEVGRALERIEGDGLAIDVANLDYCGNFSTPVVESVQRVANNLSAFRPTAALALTVLRGREDTATVTALRMLNEARQRQPWDCDMRLDALFREAGFHDRLVRSGEYQSQTQRMAWAVAARYDTGRELAKHTDALVRACGSVNVIARMNADLDDLAGRHHGNYKDTRRYPYVVTRDGHIRRKRQIELFDPKKVDYHETRMRARDWCDRKAERIAKRRQRLEQRYTEHPSSDLPFPYTPASGGQRCVMGDHGPRLAFAHVSRSSSPYPTGRGAAAIYDYLHGSTGYRPFDEWWVNRHRLAP